MDYLKKILSQNKKFSILFMILISYSAYVKVNRTAVAITIKCTEFFPPYRVLIFNPREEDADSSSCQ